MKDLEPLYELLATIVHMDFPDPVHAIRETIPTLNQSVITLLESLPLNDDIKEEMKPGVMWYMYENIERLARLNETGDFSNQELLSAYIHRFQLDAERTRIYLELFERNPKANTNYQLLDF